MTLSIDHQEHAMLVSGAYLARVAEISPLSAAADFFLIAIRRSAADQPADGRIILRFAAADPLPALHWSAACTSDDTARARLAAADVETIALLPDAGHPAALWRAAERLGLCSWLDSAADLDTLACVLARLADAAGLVGRARLAVEPLGAALEVVVACIAGDHADGPVALRDAARRAGLWPRPALGLGLLPVGLGGKGRAALRAMAGAPALFRAAAAALRDHAPDGLLPAPAPRPALLGAIPPTSDPGEAEMLARFEALGTPLPLLPMPDLAALQARLVEEFPWLRAVTRALMRGIALNGHGNGVLRLPPTLLVGPPGVGKTRFTRALAEACGLPWRRLGVSDAAAVTSLTGNGRGWRSGRPCLAAATIIETGMLNPLLVIDDIDRAASDDRNGTPSNFLLSQLEAEGARGFLDTFLLAPIDLSAVNWILTANDTRGLPGALLDRVLLLEVGPPPASVVDGLLRSLLADIAAELGLPGEGGLPSLPASTLALLRQVFISGDVSIRVLGRAVRQALGAVILGDDPVPIVRAELALAACRDDRPYAAGRVGFHVQAREVGA